MTPTTQGSIVLVVTLLMLLSGVPVAFGLGAISIVFLLLFQGFSSMHVVAETFYGGLDEFTLVAIPMFVMMGAAIGSSPAGKDLYEALDRWLYRLPGSLVLSNLGACAIFAALTGSSPACCAAIGKMGIPEMRRRGYPDEIATGSICAGGTLGILIPPSVTFILYGIATETSIGRLFIAGVMPGVLLTGMFMLWSMFAIWRSGFRPHAVDFRYSWKEKFSSIPKIAPFIFIIFGVMYALYGGVATPSEAAGVGAALCLILAILIYRLWQPQQIWMILRDTMRESVMILTIIAAAVLFGYMLTSLYLTQTLAQAIADAHFNRWVLMLMINLFLLVCGFFIPPSVTFILYGIATETSIGRLFIAGVMPGVMLTAMFMLWSMFAIWRSGFRPHAPDFRYSWKEKFASVPKIAPFIFIIFGVMYALYGGIATPSEAAGVGAALCLILAIAIYKLWRPDQIWTILRDTMRESVMILTIIAAAVLFGYMLTSLYLTQTLAQAIADAHFNRWVLMLMINLFLLVCGFFIPPAAIILMTSPILLPIITAAGFDPVWFGVILTINMEIGLIHPPVGLNIYIVNAIAPDVPVVKVMWGTLPYVICMMLAIVILCIFPEIATWLPNHLMGVGK